MRHTKRYAACGVNITPYRYAKSVGARMSYGVVANHLGDQVVESANGLVRSGWRSEATAVNRATDSMFRVQPCSTIGDLDANRVGDPHAVLRRWMRHRMSLPVSRLPLQ